LVLARNYFQGLEIPSVKEGVEVEDLQFETWTPETIQLAYSAGLEALASPGVSYQDFYTPPHENGLARRGRNPFPVRPL
jgi:hypothetical protein